LLVLLAFALRSSSSVLRASSSSPEEFSSIPEPDNSSFVIHGAEVLGVVEAVLVVTVGHASHKTGH
jgi:hypothetical protein